MDAEPGFDAAVLGGGPAGLSAALMLGRACRSVLVLDSALPRNRFAAHMHGVLGHDGRPPSELLAAGLREVRSYGGSIEHLAVDAVEPAQRGFVVLNVHPLDHDLRRIPGRQRGAQQRLVIAADPAPLGTETGHQQGFGRRGMVHGHGP